MGRLDVTPTYLEKLAMQQDDAAKTSGDAATAAAGIETAVWVTHGVISGVSNAAFTSAEAMRREAGRNIQTASSDLAAKLRAAKQVYEGVDQDLSGTINAQIEPR